MFHPLRTLAFLAGDGAKRMEYLATMSVPTGFSYAISAPSAFLAAPSLLFNLLSNYRGQYTVKGQYNAPVIPFLLIATALGALKLLSYSRDPCPEKRKRMGQGIGVYMVISGMIVTYYFSPSPLARDHDLARYTFTSHASITQEILKEIPSDATVCAQSDLVPHLSHREIIHVFPVDWQSVDYIVLDLYGTCFPVSASQYRDSVERVFKSSSMGIRQHNDGVLLFRRSHDTKQNSAVLKKYRALLSRRRLPDGRIDMTGESRVVPRRTPRNKQ